MLGGNGFGALGGHIGTRASELLDGRMSPEDEHRARLHLGRCPQCAMVVAAEQDARDALRSMAMPTSLTPPSDLVAGLMAISNAYPVSQQPMDQPALPTPAGSELAHPQQTLPRLAAAQPALPQPIVAEPGGAVLHWHRHPRLRGALAVSGLLAAGVTAAVTITSSTPPVQRQAGSVARVSPAASSGPRAFNQANLSLETKTEPTITPVGNADR